MNFSVILGILLAIGVLGGTIISEAKDGSVFLNIHAFAIVIGGTTAAALISFSGKKMFTLLSVFVRRILGRNDEVATCITEIVDLARGYRENDNYLRDKLPSLKTPFLKEAIQLTVEGGIDPQDIDVILKKRAVAMHARHEEDSDIFKALAKFPPAFGLLGAVIGMISLMQGLGGADAFQRVGPAMAVALVATMYGIAVANFIFLPLGENLAKLNRFDAILRQMVMDGVKLIRQKKHPLVVEETIKSYLLPGERSKLKKAA